MKKPHFSLLTSVVPVMLGVLAGCPTPGTTTTTTPPSGVYNAGSYTSSYQTACYWTNATKTDLPGVDGATATSIFVSGSTIYIAGQYNITQNSGINGGFPVACYWTVTNGVVAEHDLSGTLASSIYVYNGTIYVAGYYFNGTYNTACYWSGTNATPVPLPNLGHGNSFANSVYVNGNSIYFAGQDTNLSLNSIAVYWPSVSTERSLTNSGGKGLANSIYVSGSTIYVAGTDTGTSEACYWSGSDPISATATSITTGSGVAKSIFVSGGTIYAAGQNGSTACYWTGSSLSTSPISLSSSSSIANSIYFLSGTIYISGQIGTTASYWTVTGGTLSSPVSLPGSNAQANSIFAQ